MCGDYYIGGREFDTLSDLIGYYTSWSDLLKGERLQHPVPPPEVGRLIYVWVCGVRFVVNMFPGPIVRGRPELPSFSLAYTAYVGKEGVKGRCVLFLMLFMVHCDLRRGLKINIFKVL